MQPHTRSSAGAEPTGCSPASAAASARYFDVNPTFYRVGFVVLTLLGGAGILIYGAALLVMPDEGQSESIVEEALRDHRDRPWRARRARCSSASPAIVAPLPRRASWPHGDAAWISAARRAGAPAMAAAVLAARTRATRCRRQSPGTDAEPSARRRRRDEPGPRPTRRTAVRWLAVRDHGARPAPSGSRSACSSSPAASSGARSRRRRHPWAVALAVGAVASGVGDRAAAFLRLRVGGLAFLGLLLGAAALARLDVASAPRTTASATAPTPRVGRSRSRTTASGSATLELDLSQRLAPGRADADRRDGSGSATCT